MTDGENETPWARRRRELVELLADDLRLHSESEVFEAVAEEGRHFEMLAERVVSLLEQASEASKTVRTTQPKANERFLLALHRVLVT